MTLPISWTNVQLMLQKNRVQLMLQKMLEILGVDYSSKFNSRRTVSRNATTSGSRK